MPRCASCRRSVEGTPDDPLACVCLRDGGTKVYCLACAERLVGLEETFPEVLGARWQREALTRGPVVRRNPITLGDVRREQGEVPCLQ